MKALFTLIWILCWTASPSIFAQDFSNLHFRNLQVNDGLSENSVYSILQDQTGYMWFGTKDGLNRFDGKDFRVYQKRKDDPFSIRNNFIRSIAEKDSSHLYIGTDQGLEVMDKHREAFYPIDQPATNGSIVHTAINALHVDRKDQLWIGTMGQGIYRYDPLTDVLRPVRIRGLDLGKNATWCFLEDQSGTIWAGTRLGLLRYNPDRGEFECVTGLFNAKDNAEFEILSMMEDTHGQLWLGTWRQGLLKYNKSTGSVDSFLDKQGGPFLSHIRRIFHYDKDRLLVGSDDGLYLFQTKSGAAKRLDRPHFQHSLSDQNVYAIARDREHGIWIGTYFGGVNYLNTALLPIETFHSDPQDGFLSGKAVSQFCEDPAGNLWIATEDGGINYYNRKTGEISQPIETTYHNTHALLLIDDQLLIGTFSRGLDVYDLKTKTLRNYRFDSGNENTINDDCIFSLYQTRNGEIYVGTPVGLNKFDLRTGRFTRIPEVREFIYDIKQDDSGDIWLASYQAGPIRYSQREQRWIFYSQTRAEHPISNSKLTGIYRDSHGRILFSSEGSGIFIYNKENDTFRQISQEHGLPNTVIYGILDDPHGYLWLSSNRGLLRIHPDRASEVKAYTTDYGLQSNQYNYKSALKTKDGKFFFGGINGFSSFYPQEFIQIANPVSPTVAISQIELLNADNQELSKTVQTSLNRGAPIVLPYHQASFTLSFVSLSYSSPKQNQYAYQLVGTDETWRQAGNRQSVTYLNVPPGTYTFRVRGSNNDGVWDMEGTEITIEILPPVWLSLPAKIAYVVLLLTAAWLVVRWYRARNKRTQRRELDRVRLEEEQKSFQSKIEFFTQITHEIRTPVSLITAPLEEVLESSDISPEARQNLQLVDRNCNRLHVLIDQLLDFRKMEEGKLLISPERTDLRVLLTEIFERFRKSAQKNGQKLILDLPAQKQLFLETDAEALNKIVSNLLSNALKFARRRIRLALSVAAEERRFTIEVQDDGMGIPLEHQALVFNPFYQVGKPSAKSGTGIGLSLVKNFAEQIGGTLQLESTPLKGTRFIFSFSDYPPLPQWPQPEEPAVAGPNPQEAKTQEQKVLVVDDNRELCAFIAQSLSGEYQVQLANHGGQALELLEKDSYALVVSDIMMPGIDGLSLVEKLRADMQYSHIPIILLSARTENATKIRGLLSGADVFMEKPFSPSYLKAQIASLLRNRLALVENFQENPLAPFSALASNSSDEQFLGKLNAEIEQHLGDDQFSVDSMAHLLGLSRSAFQRKLKAISGYSPGDYLRTYRLKRACVWLVEGEYRINEIAYRVGFKSPSYFTKAFLKAFHLTPKEFASQKKTNGVKDN